MEELDRSLLDRFVRGEQEAFEAIFRRFQAEVYRWVVRILRDDSAAEEVVVEAFWRAYRGRARFDPSRSFGAWMRRIATHASIDHIRAQRRHGRVRALPEAAAGESDETLSEAVGIAFRRLSPRLQVVATLALVEGRSHGEIAQALGVPVGTVKSRLFRATRALRKDLERLGVRP